MEGPLENRTCWRAILPKVKSNEKNEMTMEIRPMEELRVLYKTVFLA